MPNIFAIIAKIQINEREISSFTWFFYSECKYLNDKVVKIQINERRRGTNNRDERWVVRGEWWEDEGWVVRGWKVRGEWWGVISCEQGDAPSLWILWVLCEIKTFRDEWKPVLMFFCQRKKIFAFVIDNPFFCPQKISSEYILIN